MKFTISRLLRAVVFSIPLAVSASIPLSACGGGGDECCRVCDVGKACGDTCIAMTATCTVGSGCACNK